MRRLIIANTHFQIIVTIQLKLTLFQSDSVVLLISDHSNGSECVCEKLKDQKLFEQVHFISSKEILYNTSRKTDWIDFLQFSFMKKNRYYSFISQIDDLWFDELLMYNIGPDMCGLYNYLASVNKKILISRFEEGLLSYKGKGGSLTRKAEISCYIKNVLWGYSMYNSMSSFYCFFPRLYNGQLTAKSIPLIDKDGCCVEILKKLYGVKDRTITYSKKYIFFPSVFDFEGGKPIGELEVLNKVASVVGKDNILVKMHPRDTRSVYADSGYSVDANSDIPWEIVQASGDFSNHILLSAVSAAPLVGSTFFGGRARVVYLFELCNLDGNFAKKNADDIRMLINHPQMRENFSNICIIRGIEELHEE